MVRGIFWFNGYYASLDDLNYTPAIKDGNKLCLSHLEYF